MRFLKHKSATCIDLKTNQYRKVEFGDIDGKMFGAVMDEEGYKTETALLIVNRWNYIATLQPRAPEYFYYLHTVGGAC